WKRGVPSPGAEEARASLSLAASASLGTQFGVAGAGLVEVGLPPVGWMLFHRGQEYLLEFFVVSAHRLRSICRLPQISAENTGPLSQKKAIIFQNCGYLSPSDNWRRSH